ncbi:polynucleotide phosphorylase/polyadenylase [Erysipelotrichaceae bacterium]|nr:polynucleotide phosphorylase/polyadenylase [Erysipelotrichaceae bacterium]
MSKKIFSTQFGNRKIVFETGQIAKQANGAVIVRYGDTVILCTAVASKSPKNLDFFPLTVNYEERLYAAGKIPGGFIKREGRPTEFATLASRLIDRPIRPLFAEGFRNDVQVVTTVLSVDTDNTPEIAAMVGASLALSISNIPFDGPIAGVKVGRVNGEFIINPTIAQLEQSDVDLSVAGTKYAINMVEAGAAEVDETVMLDAIMFGHRAICEMVLFQEQIIAEIGQPKMAIALYAVDSELDAKIRKTYGEALCTIARIHSKVEHVLAMDAIIIEILAEIEDQAMHKQAKEIAHNVLKEEVRRLITDEKIRPDGRSLTEIRNLAAEIDFLPRTHGSALFTRGETQALSVCTLGALNENQRLDGLDVEETKRFMLHYNFPPYSVGETGRIGGAGRREIGHGALGERAIRYVMPSEVEFPYTVRIVSEIVESNGSTSQASICAGTMALMSAGVPLKAPVAGIAMGLIMKDENYAVLTDIQGLEDHLGDMDFKVAGTAAGITALQMDIKIDGINEAILKEALAQAKIARMQVLKVMCDTIDKPRKSVSEHAPKVVILAIKPDKIRDVIGPGGKQINAIIEQTSVKIDIEQDGTVCIYGTDEAMTNKAKQLIEDIVREVAVGEQYHAKVVRVEKFGAFVELYAGKDALVHISKISKDRIENIDDVLKLGDILNIKVTEIDDRGRVNAAVILD